VAFSTNSSFWLMGRSSFQGTPQRNLSAMS
jgi:hypothetical protein